jgi:glycosyltransferase involved in cell wall biosynthesis
MSLAPVLDPEPPQIDVVIPVHNEAHVLAASVRALDAHLRSLPFSHRITIADNASTDGTLLAALALADESPAIRVLHLARKGRGRALRAAWSSSDADVLAYMDVDLSTDLAAFGDLVEPLLAGRGDLAVGSRLSPGSDVTRSLRREVISRSYNILLRLALRSGFADAQCGFKAGRREVLLRLLPMVADEEWFFDTELLHAARRGGFAIREIPVRWVEDRDSRVRILATARADLRGILRLRGADRDAERRAQSAPATLPAGRRVRSLSR